MIKCLGVGIVGKNRSKRLLRIIIPRYPFPNVFSFIRMPPIGPFYVGASVRQTLGWDVEIIDENNYRGRLNHAELQNARPADVVGFYGGLTSTAPRLYELARLYAGLGVLTIAGGGHVDALPEEALDAGVTVVIRGEGEKSVPEVLTALEESESLTSVPGIAFMEGGEVIITEPRPPVKELGNLPHPDLNMLANPEKRIVFAPICHSRGCIYRCEFCCVNRLLGPPRVAPTSHTIEQYSSLLADGYRRYFFVDDNFACSREKTLELCDEIARISGKLRVKPSITVQVRIDVAEDKELLAAMKRAGVRVLCLGIESPIEADLKEMRKGVCAGDMLKQIRTLRGEGFMLHGMFIFGYPIQSREVDVSGADYKGQARAFMDFIRRAKLDTIQVLKAVPIPGTRLFRRLKDAGRLLPLDKVGWDKYDGNFMTFVPDGGRLAELQEAGTGIMKRFYSWTSGFKLSWFLFLAPVLVSFNAGVEWIRLVVSAWGRCTRTRMFFMSVVNPIVHFEWILSAWRVSLVNYVRLLRRYSLQWVGRKLIGRWMEVVRRSRALDTIKMLDEEIRARELGRAEELQ